MRMRGILAFALLLAGCPSAARAGSPANRSRSAAPASRPAGEVQRAEDHVVTLKVAYQDFDERTPWARRPPSMRTGTATVVEGRFLLTSFYIVKDATLIRVHKRGLPQSAVARVRHWDPFMNLALLEVTEAGFTDDLVPVPISDANPRNGELKTARWKDRQLEIADLRVQKADVQLARSGGQEHVFLVGTTDLAEGGWAEPVFRGRELAGMTTSQDGRTAYVVPAGILAAYLAQARTPATYTGFAGWEARYQVNDDPALAAWLGQEGSPRGIVLRKVPWGATGRGVLQPRDILLSLDGHEIDSSGFYEHPRFGLLDLDQIVIDGHRPGDVVPARILRQGRVMDVQVPLRRYVDSDRLVPRFRVAGAPPYVIAGGLVFRELSMPYLETWGDKWHKKAPVPLVVRLDESAEDQQPGHRRIVFLQGVIPIPYNVGYQELRDLEVREVNGRTVDSLPALDEALRHPVDGFHRVRFAPNGSVAEIVLDADGMEAATRFVLANYRIPRAVVLPQDAPGDLGPACGGGLAP